MAWKGANVDGASEDKVEITPEESVEAAPEEKIEAAPEEPAEAAPEGETEEAPEGEIKAAPKKKKSKKLVILGVVVVVIVAIGAGLWVWHEQPSFCNAICHTPMDPYLPTFESTPGQPAEDKWGNEVKDANAMLAATHRANQNSTCTDCHVPTLSQQVSEAMAWVSGNYEVKDNEKYGMVIHERALEDLTEEMGVYKDEFCLNERCHNMTRADLTAKTANLARNPHAWYHAKQDCNECHKAHRASVMLCTKCHGDAVVPDGWINAAQNERMAA